ncbi:MAG TPA: hypothetical protein VGL19_01095 [Polyangiaceae bacterium]
MTHSETSRRGSVPKNVACGLSCVLLLVACNVYDSSLLDSNALANGGSSNSGGAPISSSGADSTSGSGNNPSGGSGNATGGIGFAGADNAGDSSGGTAASAGTGGVVSMAGGGVVSGGSGGGQAGGSTGGTTSLSLSLIDDMETVDANIPAIDGRQGFWSVANDGTAAGKQTPSPTVVMSMIPGGRGTSLSAFHTTAMGFISSGALVGVDLNRKGSTRSTYDASAYNAVHFWIKVEAGSPTAVHFAILDKHTDPGGAWCCIAANNCTGGGTFATGGLCYDHFGKDLPPVTTAWVERTVQFSELGQVGWGDNKVTVLDTAHVFGLQLNWLSPAMDLWIDDISFVKK